MPGYLFRLMLAIASIFFLSRMYLYILQYIHIWLLIGCLNPKEEK